MRSAAKEFGPRSREADVQALRVGHARFQRLLESNMVGVAVAGATGAVSEANDYFLDLVGFTRPELVAGRVRWADVTPPEHLPADENALAELRAGGVCTPYEKEFLRRDGTLVPVLISDAMLDGPREQILKIVLDLTERRRAEDALRQSEERFRHIFQDGPLGMAVFDAQGRFLQANRALCRMLGTAERELLTRTVAGVTHPDDVEADAAQLRRLVAGELASYATERQLVRKDGKVRWARVTTSFLPPSGAGRACGIQLVEDVTLRRRAEAAEKERNDLRDAVRALDRVLGVVGHELRTPLAATRAMTELLLSDDVRTGPDGRRLLQAANDEIVRMGAMVNDLLEVARLNSGTARWNWSDASVARACREAADSVRPLVDPRAVTLDVTAEPEDLSLAGDGDAVRRLVLNLLTNAHKHTRAGSIRVRAARHRERDVDYVRIEVSDTGNGIAPEITAKLGDAFVLNSGIVGDDYVKGSGLGLAICRGIVAAHGGRMSVASTPGKGTVVTVLLRTDLPAPAAGGGEVRITVEAA